MSDIDFAEVEVTDKMMQEAFTPQSRGALAVSSVPSPVGPQEHIGAQNVAVYRDVARINVQLKALAAMAGDSWFYRYPVKTKNGLKHIEGPTIKLANDLARTYGNCNIDVRAIDGVDNWIFYARFHDLETGYSMTRAYQQRKDQTSVNTESEGRQQDIAFQIGQSKAIRNVIVNALQTFADFAFLEARTNLIGKIGKSLGFYIEKCLARLDELNINHTRVERMVGRSSSDWLAPDVSKIIAEIQAISDGMATADEMYPRDKPEAGNTAKDDLDQFSNKPEVKSSRKPAKKAKPETEEKPEAKTQSPETNSDELPLNDTETDPVINALMDLECELLDAESVVDLDDIDERYATAIANWPEAAARKANEAIAKTRAELTEA